MKDRLVEVIGAVNNKRTISLPTMKRLISLISFDHLSVTDIDSIRSFQTFVKQNYEVELRVVSGGYGCTTIDFEVRATTSKEAADFVSLVLSDRRFHGEALKARFKVLITRDPYERVDLRTGLTDGFAEQLLKKLDYLDANKITVNVIDESVNISGNLKDSPLILNSPESNLIFQKNPEISQLIDAITNAIRVDTSISGSELKEYLTDIETLKTELEKTKPKKKRISAILTTLGNVASISALVSQLLQLLGPLIT